jgi:hypothetical protein
MPRLLTAGFFSFVAGLSPAVAGAADYQVAEIYSKLRSQVLAAEHGSVGVKLKRPGEVFGVLMEMGYPDAAVTLVAIADGTVSIYFSNGGGIIGLGPYPGPERAARALITESQKFVKQAQPAADFPLPQQSRTRFYLLTGGGVLTAEAGTDDLGRRRHALSPLFHKGQDLITEIRKVDEQRKAKK